MRTSILPRFAAGALGAVLLFTATAPGAETAAFRQVRLGPALLSLPEYRAADGPTVPVWLHLHGNAAVVEKNFRASGAPGVLVTLTLPGLSKVYANHFADPRVLPELMREVEAALRREAPGGARPLGTLTISSFSAGFGGVRELLKQPEAFERIGALVMADSIYCGYAGDPADRRVDPGLMEGFVRFARLAAEGRKRMVVTHSRQVPEGYASTTETADYLVAQLQGERQPDSAEWPGGWRPLSRFSRGGFEVLGFDGVGPEDHLRHLREIGTLLQRVVEAR